MNDDLFALTPDQHTAYRNLFNAPGYPARPCKDDPNAWDNGSPRDVAAAIAGCRACPALAECAAMAASGVQLDGVVAARRHGTKDTPTREEVAADTELPDHGTATRYRGGCRCDDCRAWKLQHSRKYAPSTKAS